MIDDTLEELFLHHIDEIVYPNSKEILKKEIKQTIYNHIIELPKQYLSPFVWYIDIQDIKKLLIKEG